jgi:hypothetical protein
MFDKLLVKRVAMPDVSFAEANRYAGIKDRDAECDLMARAIKEVSCASQNSAVYRIVSVGSDGDSIMLGDIRVASKSLAKNLQGAEYAVIFCATVGLSVDRIIGKYSVISPSLSLLCDAVGAERIEALCDAFEREISVDLGECYDLCRRFSPGYGDLPISLQKEIFNLLRPEKYIGVTLNESLMMSPSKSVSAIIGLRRKDSK